MSQLLAAALFLLATHFGISSTGLRARLVARLGERAYLGLYSLIALIALVWLGWAYARAPYVALWPTTAAGTWLVVLIMPLALLLLVGGVSTPNPTAVGAAAALERPEPARGVLRVTRHPVMWGIGLWALVHIAANGDLASLLFFGTLAALALGGTRLLDAKYAKRLGDAWRPFAERTSNLPFAAIISGRQGFAPGEIGWWRVAIALALYLVLLALHPWLFGASPFAGI